MSDDRRFIAELAGSVIVPVSAFQTLRPGSGYQDVGTIRRNPAVVFGPGSCEQAHSLCEFVEMGHLKIVTRTYLGAALEVLA